MAYKAIEAGDSCLWRGGVEAAAVYSCWTHHVGCWQQLRTSQIACSDMYALKPVVPCCVTHCQWTGVRCGISA